MIDLLRFLAQKSLKKTGTGATRSNYETNGTAAQNGVGMILLQPARTVTDPRAEVSRPPRGVACRRSADAPMLGSFAIASHLTPVRRGAVAVRRGRELRRAAKSDGNMTGAGPVLG